PARQLEHDRRDVLTLEGVGLGLAVCRAAADERLAADVQHVEEPDQIEEERIVAPAGEGLDALRPTVHDRRLPEAGRAALELDLVLVLAGTDDLDPHLLRPVWPRTVEPELDIDVRHRVTVRV